MSITSVKQIVFDHHSFQSLHLQNYKRGHAGKLVVPLMFKIRCNKVQCIDAKPNCGYIAAKEGQTQKITLKSLHKDAFNAKIQIVYFECEELSDDIIENSKKEFSVPHFNAIFSQMKKTVEQKVIIIEVKQSKPSSQFTVGQSQLFLSGSKSQTHEFQSSVRSTKSFKAAEQEKTEEVPMKVAEDSPQREKEKPKEQPKLVESKTDASYSSEKDSGLITISKLNLLVFLAIAFLFGLFLGSKLSAGNGNIPEIEIPDQKNFSSL